MSELEVVEETDQTLYCSCRRPALHGQHMLTCDVCDQWYHGECVNISKEELKTLKTWVCPACEKKTEKKKKTKNVREEVVKHLESLLNVGLDRTIDELKNSFYLMFYITQFVGPEDEKKGLEEKIHKLSTLKENPSEIETLARETENGILNKFKSEKEKGYQKQYHNLKDLLKSTVFQQSRLDLFDGVIDGLSFGQQEFATIPATPVPPATPGTPGGALLKKAPTSSPEDSGSDGGGSSEGSAQAEAPPAEVQAPTE